MKFLKWLMKKYIQQEKITSLKEARRRYDNAVNLFNNAETHIVAYAIAEMGAAEEFLNMTIQAHKAEGAI